MSTEKGWDEMKKWISIFLALCMLFLMCSCSTAQKETKQLSAETEEEKERTVKWQIQVLLIYNVFNL